MGIQHDSYHRKMKHIKRLAVKKAQLKGILIKINKILTTDLILKSARSKRTRKDRQCEGANKREPFHLLVKTRL